MRPSLVFCLLTLAAPLLAATADLDQLEEQAEDLHEAAEKAEDYWTCWQLESWATAVDVRIRPCLRGHVEVVGDARHAYPDRIHAFWDRGDEVVVIAGQRCFKTAPDGRPLQASVKLPFWPNRSSLSDNGRYLAITDISDSGGNAKVHLAIVDLAGKSRTIEKRLALAPTDHENRWYFVSGPTVADDGTSAIVTVTRRTAGNQALLLRPDSPELLPIGSFDSAAEIGAAFGWMVCRGGPYGYHPQLVKPDGTALRQLPGSYQSRHGRIFFLDEGQVWTLRERPEPEPWQGAVPIGSDGGAMTSIGPYLVIESGSAPPPDNGDFLPPPSDQPDRVSSYLVFDWAAIAADPGVEPLYRLTDLVPLPAVGFDATFLDWEGDLVRLRHLGPAGETVEDLGRGPGPIAQVRNAHHHLHLQLEDGSHAIMDLEGRVLFHDIATDLWVSNRHQALIAHGPRDARTGYQVVELAPEPADRRVINLAIPTGEDWRVDIDDLGRWIVARQGRWLWRQLDAETGLLVHEERGSEITGLKKNPPHTERLESHRDGRFYKFRHDSSRLLPIRGGRESQPWPQRWELHDALLIAGRDYALLARDGSILYQKRREWQVLDRYPEAEAFCHDERGRDLYLGGREHRNKHDLIAQVSTGLNETRRVREERQGKELDDQGWRMRSRRGQLQFAIPGKGRRMRFRPDLLLDPIGATGGSRTVLLLIYPSLVVAIDGTAAEVLAEPID